MEAKPYRCEGRRGLKQVDDDGGQAQHTACARSLIMTLQRRQERASTSCDALAEAAASRHGPETRVAASSQRHACNPPPPAAGGHFECSGGPRSLRRVQVMYRGMGPGIRQLLQASQHTQRPKEEDDRRRPAAPAGTKTTERSLRLADTARSTVANKMSTRRAASRSATHRATSHVAAAAAVSATKVPSQSQAPKSPLGVGAPGWGPIFDLGRLAEALPKARCQPSLRDDVATGPHQQTITVRRPYRCQGP